jgi:hypothetical protein
VRRVRAPSAPWADYARACAPPRACARASTSLLNTLSVFTKLGCALATLCFTDLQTFIIYLLNL